MTYKLLAASVILGTAAAAAIAMTDMDADGDGMLSFAEFQAAYPELTAAEFEASDVNADGQIDETELADAVAAGILPATKS